MFPEISIFDTVNSLHSGFSKENINIKAVEDGADKIPTK